MKQRVWAIILGLGAYSAFINPSMMSGAEEAAQEKETIERRIVFLQKHFAKFAPVKFENSTNSEAVLQQLRVREHLLEHEGMYYSGFRFTVPKWIDGDFTWFWCLAKTEAQKDFFADGMSFYIIPEKGRSPGFDYFHTGGFAGHKYLQQRFPYTRNFVTQHLDMDRLKPGSTYGIWFAFKEKELPDIAFAITIDSARGKKEIGTLPLR